MKPASAHLSAATAQITVAPAAKLVTIWANYGPYHLARVQALDEVGFDVRCFSYCSRVTDYPFFGLTPPNHTVINDCEFHEVKPLVSFWRTLRLLRKYAPQIIMSCGYERAETLAALVYARTSRQPRPIAILMVENKADDRPRSALIEAVKAQYLRLFDGFAVGGTAHRAYLVSLGVSRDRIVSGYDCVDNSRIAELSRAFRRSGERFAPSESYFLCLARLVKKKNIPTLVTAYNLYRAQVKRQSRKPWDLVICGDGPQRIEVERLVSDLDLRDCIRMDGSINEFDSVINYLAHSKALVLPSAHGEQWGLVVNEAMAAGVPVVVSAECGCAADLVHHGVNGFVFNPSDAYELSRHLLWLQENEDELHGMGNCSAELIRSFSTLQFATNVSSLYWRLTSGSISARLGMANARDSHKVAARPAVARHEPGE